MLRKKLTQTEAENFLSQYHQSGLSRLEFAQKHNLSFSLFTYWIPRLKKRAQKKHPPFQEVTIPSAIHNLPCTLTIPSGAKLEFPISQFSIALAALLNGQQPC